MYCISCGTIIEPAGQNIPICHSCALKVLSNLTEMPQESKTKETRTSMVADLAVEYDVDNGSDLDVKFDLLNDFVNPQAYYPPGPVNQIPDDLDTTQIYMRNTKTTVTPQKGETGVSAIMSFFVVMVIIIIILAASEAAINH